jgi:hypothetical protein
LQHSQGCSDFCCDHSQGELTELSIFGGWHYPTFDLTWFILVTNHQLQQQV